MHGWIFMHIKTFLNVQYYTQREYGISSIFDSPIHGG